MGCNCGKNKAPAMVASAVQNWVVTKSDGTVLDFGEDFAAAQRESTDSGGVLAQR